jgi:branched-chain amino acid transport system substrate-binding protein
LKKEAFMKHLVFAAIWLICTAAGAAQDLVVGQVASKTHPNSALLAKGLEVGYRIGFAEFNSRGGVNGRQLVIENVDDGFAAAKMIDATKALAARPEVIALAGYVGSGGMAEMAKTKLLEQLKLPMVAPLQGDKAVVSAANFFPFRAGYEDEVIAMTRHAIQTAGRKRLAVIYLAASFGPPLAKRVEEEAKLLGVELIAKEAYEVAPDKIEASSKAAGLKVAAADADGVILVAAGKAGSILINELRAGADGKSRALYSISALQSQDVVNSVGEVAARGVIFAQSVPFPYGGSAALIREYQAVLAKHAPSEAPSFSSLEGYAGAKIVIAAVRKAGPNPTRESVLAALSSLGEYDLGGYAVRYDTTGRRGWGKVDLTIIGAGGKLLK